MKVKGLKKLAIAGILATSTAAIAGITITGAGATFPYPIYSAWAYAYEKATETKLTINQSVLVVVSDRLKTEQ
jgi:phosphate-binding protein